MRWQLRYLLEAGTRWIQHKRVKRSAWGEQSPWWSFMFNAPQQMLVWIRAFQNGHYHFSPLKAYVFPEEEIILWSCEDRLIQALLLQIIKPVLPFLVSSRCLHLKGPSGVPEAIQQIQAALKARPYRYCIRADIRSYYASIDHTILLNQLNASFQDPRLQDYFQQIVTAAIDRQGVLYTPTKGIPLRGSLSPVFGALYLTPLDRAFEQRRGVFYLRYMDDIVILAETHTQYKRAQKILFQQLRFLKLTLSPTKG